jgi:hypothetical protein
MSGASLAMRRPFPGESEGEMDAGYNGELMREEKKGK